jgi:FkbM family methyltransferase
VDISGNRDLKPMTFISYAQNCEDVILHRALREVEHGFYVDVGANSPDEHSVTRAFYERGWRGINIEPVKFFHEQLAAARPRDINLPIALGESTGAICFHDIPGTGLSTIDPAIAARHREAGREVAERPVEIETLDNVLRKYGVETVHFLKIDVEGHEAAVLRGTALETVRPWIIVVEAIQVLNQSLNHQEWDAWLTGRGYRFVYFDGLNRYYLAEERSDLTQRFESPPNIFDDWMRVHDWRAHDLVGRLSAALTDEQLAHQKKNEEVAAIKASLSSIEASLSWRITAPLRRLKSGLRRQPVAEYRIGIMSLPHRVLRRGAHWAVRQPVIKRIVVGILVRHPALERKARALIGPMASVPSTTSRSSKHGPTMVSRSPSAAERRVEAAFQRAMARVR